jgi:hypothetical protein
MCHRMHKVLLKQQVNVIIIYKSENETHSYLEYGLGAYKEAWLTCQNEVSCIQFVLLFDIHLVIY